jgi:excinuclease UvrABC ATPase subunit
VIVIEHNLDVIAEADWLVEIGPEGGTAGGEIVFQGQASKLLNCKHSPTRPFLETHLDTRA